VLKMAKLELYKAPSLIAANNSTAIQIILQNKAEEYQYNQARLQDYIGRGLNNIQEKENYLILEKARIEEQLKDLRKSISKLNTNIAIALQDLGIEKLDDKTADVISSIKVLPRVDPKVELKERALTLTECKDLLKANGLPVTKIDEVVIEAKEESIKVNYKRGGKVKALTPKEAKEKLLTSYLEDDIEERGA